MDAEELADLVDTLRRIGGESADVEVKSGAGGFPKSVRESLVAFANTGGGVVIIGVDEATGFQVVSLPDPVHYRDMILALSRDEVEPPLNIVAEVLELEGSLVVAATIPPTPPDLRPVYVRSKGVSNGTFLRTGDGDRRMSQAEIALTYASRTQPTYDREPIAGSTQADLDEGAVLRTLERLRTGSASLRGLPNSTALFRVGIVSAPDPDAPLTLAGLLAFGSYPQQFFPQLMVSVVVHPAVDDPATRFLDNATMRGSIPEIVAESLGFVRRNLAARSVVVDGSRADHIDYPIEAIREAIVNALLHRDYSPVTRGSQVQMELFSDRLVVRSPGGLYGPIAEEDLGQIGVSSSRNAVLASLLSDTFLPQSTQLVAENRASGIPTMLASARRNGLPPPQFSSTVASFVVTMDRSQLLGPEVREWLRSTRMELPTSVHEIAMAMMRGGYVTNAALREWGANPAQAGQVLRDLVAQGAAVRQGGRRYRRYVLDASIAPGTGPVAMGALQSVEYAMRAAGTATASDLIRSTRLSRVTVTKHLRALMLSGLVRAEGAPRSPKRRYVWVGLDRLL